MFHKEYLYIHLFWSHNCMEFHKQDFLCPIDFGLYKYQVWNKAIQTPQFLKLHFRFEDRRPWECLCPGIEQSEQQQTCLMAGQLSKLSKTTKIHSLLRSSILLGTMFVHSSYDCKCLNSANLKLLHWSTNQAITNHTVIFSSAHHWSSDFIISNDK